MTVSVRLEPMTVERFPSWASESTSGFAAQQVGSGLMHEPEALAEAERAFARILPQGLATPGHEVWLGYDVRSRSATSGSSSASSQPVSTPTSTTSPSPRSTRATGTAGR